MFRVEGLVSLDLLLSDLGTRVDRGSDRVPASSISLPPPNTQGSSSSNVQADIIPNFSGPNNLKSSKKSGELWN